MKYFIILFLILSSCSFKKNPNQADELQTSVQTSDGEMLLNSIESDDTKTTLKRIESSDQRKIRGTEYESKIVEKALIRGDFFIINAVLEKYSLYSTAGNIRNYLFKKSFGADTFVSVSFKNRDVFERIIAAKPENIQSILDDENVSCEVAFDLMQEWKIWNAVNPTKFDDSILVDFLKNSQTCHLESSTFKDEWLAKEIAILFVQGNLKSYKTLNFIMSLFKTREYNSQLDKYLPKSIFNEIDLVKYLGRKSNLVNEASSIANQITSISKDLFSPSEGQLYSIEDETAKVNYINTMDAQIDSLRDIAKGIVPAYNVAFSITKESIERH